MKAYQTIMIQVIQFQGDCFCRISENEKMQADNYFVDGWE